MRTCVFCREEILAESRRCGYCGRSLAVGWRLAATVLTVLLLGGAIALTWALAARLDLAGGVGATLLVTGLVGLGIGLVARSTGSAAAFVGLLVLGLLGSFAWFSGHPESRWLREVATWPVVGVPAQALRLAYLGPEPDPALTLAAAEASDEPIVLYPTLVAPMTQLRPGSEPSPSERPARNARREPTEAPREPRPTTSESAPVVLPPPRLPSLDELESYTASAVLGDVEVDHWVWLLPGTPLYTDRESTMLPAERLSALSYLPVVDFDQNLAQVWHRGVRRWLDPNWSPGLPTKGSKPKRLNPVLPNDVVRLRHAREVLGVGVSERTIGPYRLITDVTDDDLLDLLDNVLSRAEEAYFGRYGRRPGGKANRTMVLFSARADYETYAGRAANLPDMTTAGHAGRGIVALYVEGRDPMDVAETLLHETTHLLNHRALGPGLPAWLEEGIASDLGACWIEPIGDAAPRLTSRDRTVIVLGLAAQNRELPPLTELLRLPPDVFYRDDIAEIGYAHSELFVRFLVEGDDRRWAPGFRQYLKRISAGYSPEAGMLLGDLDAERAEIEERFLVWLNDAYRQARDRLEG